MSTPFSLTLRSIQADSPRRSAVAALVGGGLLALWSLWFFGSEVRVYALSREARLEVAQAASPVVAERGGVVAAVYAHPGDQVSEGDVLVELKIDAELLDVDGARSSQDALSITLEAHKTAFAARSEAFASELRGLQAAVASAEGALRAAEGAERAARQDAERAEIMLERQVIGAAERDAAVALAQVKAGELAEARATARGAAEALGQRQDEQEAEAATLQGEIDSLSSDLEAAWAGVSRKELQVERAQLRAPVDGVLGAMDGLGVGSAVAEGAEIATVVPIGDLKVIARFAPEDAIGRVIAGQPARLRLTGFPWTQYGVLDATVSGVASEARDGLIVVELDPVEDPASNLPLQHALPGQVEVEVERVSPATLALRLAGGLVRADPNRAP